MLMEEMGQKEISNKKAKENIIPRGFGKGINDYYNQNVTVADAKAGAILAANFILLGGLISLPFSCNIKELFLMTSFLIILSVICCGIVLFPRLPKSKNGLIFWENVKSHSNSKDYLNELYKLNNNSVEVEYAKQNWHVSKVLSTKNLFVRIALIFIGISIVFLVASYITLFFDM